MADKKKKAEPEPEVVVPPRAYRDEDGVVRVEVNGVSHPVSEQDLLALRDDVNALAVGVAR